MDKIPDYQPTFEEIAKQMKINAEIIMQMITNHANKEIERIKKERENLKPFNN